MAYTQVTLANALSQLSTLFDDPDERYWTATEKTYAIWEALRVWGAYTNYWRERGTFTSSSSTTWYDLSTLLPALRPRVWTLEQLTQDVQYACLEAANGIAGAGMSQQISPLSIVQAIKRARNQFVLDVFFPITTAVTIASPAPPDGMTSFTENAAIVHRVNWQDAQTGVWTNLWREDAWATDKSNPDWTLEPSVPTNFSESENAPLKLQLDPPPIASGALEALIVESLDLNVADPDALLGIPDEWVHAVKWCALADIFSAESQNADPLRAQYADHRYKQAVDLAKDARSIMRVLLSEKPLPIDSMAAVDSSMPFWRNQPGQPFMGGALYDVLALAPVASGAYGIAVDVVRAAPLPTAGTDKLQIGLEDLDIILGYASHIMTFKCGGTEFQSTFSNYDEFMQAVQHRGKINKTKIRYMSGLLGQPQKEMQDRPDAVEVGG